jgi:hypothetical protein
VQIADTGLVFDSTSAEAPLRACSFTSLLLAYRAGPDESCLSVHWARVEV